MCLSFCTSVYFLIFRDFKKSFDCTWLHILSIYYDQLILNNYEIHDFWMRLKHLYLNGIEHEVILETVLNCTFFCVDTCTFFWFMYSVYTGTCIFVHVYLSLAGVLCMPIEEIKKNGRITCCLIIHFKRKNHIKSQAKRAITQKTILSFEKKMK